MDLGDSALGGAHMDMRDQRIYRSNYIGVKLKGTEFDTTNSYPTPLTFVQPRHLSLTHSLNLQPLLLCT